MQSSTKVSNWNISTVVGDTSPDVVVAKQLHSNILIPVCDCDTNTVADGLIGSKGDKAFGIRTADCMPLVLTTKDHAYGIHISRKTLVAGILEETIQHLGNEKIDGAYIGPHICEACFTFSYKGEGIEKFEAMFPHATKTKKQITHLSLLKVIMRFLEESKVSQGSIVQDTRCTFETPELPSYRRWLEAGKAGKLIQITTVIRFE